MGKKLNSTLVRLIQVRRSRAGWDHQTHADFMMHNFGKKSCIALTEAQAEEYLDHLENLGQGGNRPKQAAGGYPKKTLSQDEYAIMLWNKLHKDGIVKDKSIDALGKFCQRTVGVAQLSWCAQKQKSAVITALKKWLEIGGK